MGYLLFGDIHSEAKFRISLILLLVLVLDVAYGVLSFGTAYGCGAVPVTLTETKPTESPDLRVLASPCFYVYYFGMLSGSALVISLVPPPKKQNVSAQVRSPPTILAETSIFRLN